jgi:hypothetical protein
LEESTTVRAQIEFTEDVPIQTNVIYQRVHERILAPLGFQLIGGFRDVRAHGAVPVAYWGIEGHAMLACVDQTRPSDFGLDARVFFQYQPQRFPMVIGPVLARIAEQSLPAQFSIDCKRNLCLITSGDLDVFQKVLHILEGAPIAAAIAPQFEHVLDWDSTAVSPDIVDWVCAVAMSYLRPLDAWFLSDPVNFVLLVNDRLLAWKSVIRPRGRVQLSAEDLMELKRLRKKFGLSESNTSST